MILVTVGDKATLFMNKPGDDFLRFLPERFGCAPEDISVEIVSVDAPSERNRANARRTSKEIRAGIKYEIEVLNGVLGLVKHEPPTAIPGEIDPLAPVEAPAAPAPVADGDTPAPVAPPKPKRIAEGDPRTLYKKTLHKAIKTHKVKHWPYDGERFLGLEVEEA